MDEQQREWLNRTLDLINKVSLEIAKRGDVAYNEIDVLLSNIKANALIVNLEQEMKNELSLFINLLEKLGSLVKEIHLVLSSVDYDDSFMVGDNIYFYNYRLDTYIRWEDLLKLNECYRMSINLIKQFSRKAVYLILAGQKTKEEEQKLISYSPSPQPIPPTPQTPTPEQIPQ